MIRIHDVTTNQVIDREMTDAEFAQYEIDQANNEIAKAEAEAKAAAKQAVLDKLGLSAEEITALLG